jgi:hypothetical protein
MEITYYPDNSEPVRLETEVTPSIFAYTESDLKCNGRIFYFYNRELKKNAFDKSGKYAVKLSVSRDCVSNILEFNVITPSPLNQKAVSILSCSADYQYMIFGHAEEAITKKSSIINLEKVVDQCGDSFLARYSAARLGLDRFNDFQKKYPSFEKFMVKYQKDKTIEPLFDQAREYLRKGYDLPDECPIREEVLYQLGRIETIMKNYTKAISIVDELNTKYALGHYGKRAGRDKEEIIKLQQKDKLPHEN